MAPAQNLMLASADGRIAMQVVGHMPWRLNGHQTQARLPFARLGGREPLAGRDASISRTPPFSIPKAASSGNTNKQRPVDRAFPPACLVPLGATPQRITRLSRLMEARDVHTRDSFIEAQLETRFLGRSPQHSCAGRAVTCGSPGNRRPPRGTPNAAAQRALANCLPSWNGEDELRQSARTADLRRLDARVCKAAA